MTPMPENETWEAYLTDIEEAEQKANYVLFSYAADGEKYDVTKSYRTLAISHEVDGENVTEVFSYIQTKEGMEFYSPITLVEWKYRNWFTIVLLVLGSLKMEKLY